MRYELSNYTIFDTLMVGGSAVAPGHIQENSFIPEIGMKKASFWQQNKTRAEKHEADEVLSNRFVPAKTPTPEQKKKRA